MELAETLGRIAQNYGPGAAVGAAVAIVLFRVYFSKFFGRKAEHPATREDVEKLLYHLELTSRELASMRTQVARIDWLAQQQWLHGRCVNRTSHPSRDEAAPLAAGTAAAP